jgi:thiol-disulfide isomerase/thioredoxin
LTLLLSLAVLAAACGGGSEARGNGGRLLPSDRRELPTFDVASFEDLLAELRGTPVVVNVWASWCGPCRDEAPHLADAARTYAGRVQFLGVDVLDDRAAARSFIREFGWNYPSVFDPTGEIQAELGFIGPPDTVFFDSEGNRVSARQGAISEEELTAGIEAILV